MMFPQLQQAVSAYKRSAKIAMILGGSMTLGVGSAKLVDALDSIANGNYGVATDDVWAAAVRILGLVAEAVVDQDFLIGASVYLNNCQYEKAFGAYIEAMRVSPNLASKGIQELFNAN